MHPMLNTAVKAARQAASFINRASRDLDLITSTKKNHNDFVSEVDKHAEAIIIETLLDAYPNHAILAEESGTHGNSDYCWVIDPLDGTTNFLHGFPQYAISIALLFQGQPQQAVVYDPVHNDLFTASKGSGASLNERRIRVSGRTQLADALLGTGFPYRDFRHLDTYLNIAKELMQKSAGLRRPGAASLDLAYVAAGRTDGFFEFDLKPWDVAAGALLILEAGGLVTDFAGEEGWLDTGNIIAGTPKVFGQLLSVIQSHTQI